MSDKYFIQTVLEDLQYLGRIWDDSVDDAVLRRDSTILRRFLLDGALNKAWKILGFTTKIHILAPRAEYYLETRESQKIDFILAGGGLYKGVFAALAFLNKGKEVVTLPSHLNPIEHKFTLSEFLSSVSIFVDKTRISRSELVQYVANKLGGVHIDFSRTGRLAQKFETLDRNIERFVIQDMSLKGKNTIYFELLSIGQLISRAEDIRRFTSKAEEYILPK
jgi:hypothetical protein